MQSDTKWESFKWRNYDPTYARFFNADPLSEEYAYQSHYNFSENSVVNSRELEGLERVIVLGRGAAAAGAAARPSSSSRDGAYNELKGYTENTVRFWGKVAYDNYRLIKAGGTLGIGLAVKVLKSEDKSQSSENKEGSNNNESESSEVEKGTYGHLKEPKTVADGKKTTPAQRKRILEENKRQNEGELTSDGDGRKLNPPKKTNKGEKQT